MFGTVHCSYFGAVFVHRRNWPVNFQLLSARTTGAWSALGQHTHLPHCSNCPKLMQGYLYIKNITQCFTTNQKIQSDYFTILLPLRSHTAANNCMIKSTQNWVLCALSWKQRKATEHVSQYKFPAMIQHGYSRHIRQLCHLFRSYDISPKEIYWTLIHNSWSSHLSDRGVHSIYSASH